MDACDAYDLLLLLVKLNHDVFYGACDAYDLLLLLVKLRSNWLYATS